MKKILKIIFWNFSIFLVLILLLEGFFRFNKTYNFITPEFYSKIQSFVAKEKNVAPYFLTKAQLQERYSNNSLDLPKRFSATEAFDWSLNVNPNFSTYTSLTNFADSYFQNYYQRDYKNKAFRVEKFITGNNQTVKLYTVNYEYNKYGLRKGAFKKDYSPSKYNLIALGDSFTLGEGVKTGFDYPSQLNEKLGPQWTVYNSGFHGYGINDLYFELSKNPNKFSFLKNSSTIAVWLFIPGHLERAFCHLDCFRTSFDAFIYSKPVYSLENGEIRYHGSFNELNSTKLKINSYLRNSALLNFFGLDFPTKYSAEEIQTLKKIFLDIKNQLSKQTELKDFYIVNLLYFDQQNEVLPALESAGIKIIDYSNISFTGLTNKGFIPKDNHPTSETYWFLTEFLKKDLFEKFSPVKSN